MSGLMLDAARSIPASGPPISRTMPLLTDVRALALVSSAPVPTTAGVRACRAGALSTVPLFSAISAR
jgi:hypothetical protein